MMKFENKLDAINESMKRDAEQYDKTVFHHSPESINCLSYWYPKIRGEVPTPDTFFVRVSDGWNLANMIEGQESYFVDGLVAMLKSAALRVGLPCFMRTGQGSGKHNWRKCCFVENAHDIRRNVENLVEWSHMVDMMGLPHDVWVIRKMLNVSPLLCCSAYGDMPVVHEWRYFVDGEKILYGIPYWPEGALEEGQPYESDWRLALPTLQSEPSKEARQMASTVGKIVGGQWSVDVLEAIDGWYVTDMAVAERSYGWDVSRVND